MSRPQAMSEVYIYALCEPDNADSVRYIGQTRQDPDTRLYRHLRDRDCPDKFAWIESLRTQGRTPLLRILTTTKDDEAAAVEKRCINEHVARGAHLLNVQHVPGRMTEVRRPGLFSGVGPLTVRLTPEDDAELKEVATQEQIPAAILARNWITGELKRRKSTKPSTDDGDSNSTTGAHDG